jgi:hypothetical protein
MKIPRNLLLPKRGLFLVDAAVEDERFSPKHIP